MEANQCGTHSGGLCCRQVHRLVAAEEGSNYDRPPMQIPKAHANRRT